MNGVTQGKLAENHTKCFIGSDIIASPQDRITRSHQLSSSIFLLALNLFDFVCLFYKSFVPKMSETLVFFLASAGGTGGVAKARSEHSRGASGLLATRTDLERLRVYCQKRGHRIYGTLEFSGRVGNKESVINDLRRFFAACRRQEKSPLIVYSGHGEERTGNWCLPNNGQITLDDIADLHRPPIDKSCRVLTIYADCCFSGQWVFENFRKRKPVIVWSAAGPSSEAHDGVFSAAVYEGNVSAKLELTRHRGLRSRYDSGSNGYVVEGITSRCLYCLGVLSHPKCSISCQDCRNRQCRFRIDGMRCAYKTLPDEPYCFGHQR